MSLKRRNIARQDVSEVFAKTTSQLSCFRRKRRRIGLRVFSEETLGFPSVFFGREGAFAFEKEMSVTPDRTYDGNARSVPFLTATVFSRRIRSAFNNSHAQRRPHPWTPQLVRDAGV